MSRAIKQIKNPICIEEIQMKFTKTLTDWIGRDDQFTLNAVHFFHCLQQIFSIELSFCRKMTIQNLNKNQIISHFDFEL